MLLMELMKMMFHRGSHDLGGDPFRKNYACKGYSYDSSKDAFIPPKPHEFDSWVYDDATGDWKAPTSCPVDDKSYYWDEDSTSWVEFEEGPE